MEKIVLASGSPRRKELLARIGVDFSVVVSNGEEKNQPDRSSGNGGKTFAG